MTAPTGCRRGRGTTTPTGERYEPTRKGPDGRKGRRRGHTPHNVVSSPSMAAGGACGGCDSSIRGASSCASSEEAGDGARRSRLELVERRHQDDGEGDRRDDTRRRRPEPMKRRPGDGGEEVAGTAARRGADECVEGKGRINGQRFLSFCKWTPDEIFHSHITPQTKYRSPVLGILQEKI